MDRAAAWALVWSPLSGRGNRSEAGISVERLRGLYYLILMVGVSRKEGCFPFVGSDGCSNETTGDIPVSVQLNNNPIGGPVPLPSTPASTLVRVHAPPTRSPELPASSDIFTTGTALGFFPLAHTTRIHHHTSDQSATPALEKPYKRSNRGRHISPLGLLNHAQAVRVVPTTAIMGTHIARAPAQNSRKTLSAG